jgi:hypothetical protein
MKLDRENNRGILVESTLFVGMAVFLLRHRSQDVPTSLMKKTDVTEHLEVFHHVGLLVIEPPGMVGLPFN